MPLRLASEREGERIFFGDREVQDGYTVTHRPHPSEARAAVQESNARTHWRVRISRLQFCNSFYLFANLENYEVVKTGVYSVCCACVNMINEFWVSNSFCKIEGLCGWKLTLKKIRYVYYILYLNVTYSYMYVSKLFCFCIWDFTV